MAQLAIQLAAELNGLDGPAAKDLARLRALALGDLVGDVYARRELHVHRIALVHRLVDDAAMTPTAADRALTRLALVTQHDAFARSDNDLPALRRVWDALAAPLSFTARDVHLRSGRAARGTLVLRADPYTATLPVATFASADPLVAPLELEFGVATALALADGTNGTAETNGTNGTNGTNRTAETNGANGTDGTNGAWRDEGGVLRILGHGFAFARREDHAAAVAALRRAPVDPARFSARARLAR